MSLTVNITKRERQRILKSGERVVQTRYVVNFRDPRSGQRRQLFFERQKDAQRKANDITASVAMGTYAGKQATVTVRDAVAAWLDDRRGNVKERTHWGYRHVARYITDPLMLGTKQQRVARAFARKAPQGAQFVPLLGDIRIADLTTAEIRAWHKLLNDQVGSFTANRAKAYLGAALTLAAEDHNLRPPAMPSRLGRGRTREKKAILTPEQVSTLIRAAQDDPERGVYYAFPFLAGTRPSEQLALFWEDVDFERNVIRIRRMQERDGSISNMTKTSAGTREVPMGKVLREMLLAWRLRCPRRGVELHRVFPGLGLRQAWPKPRAGGGGPLLYANFRTRIWRAALQRLGLPLVTPHSARHCFISTLQAQGIEIGLVAKLAGHANAVITLGHYTQAVRGGDAAIAALEAAFA